MSVVPLKVLLYFLCKFRPTSPDATSTHIHTLIYCNSARQSGTFALSACGTQRVNWTIEEAVLTVRQFFGQRLSKKFSVVSECSNNKCGASSQFLLSSDITRTHSPVYMVIFFRNLSGRHRFQTATTNFTFQSALLSSYRKHCERYTVTRRVGLRLEEPV